MSAVGIATAAMTTLVATASVVVALGPSRRVRAAVPDGLLARVTALGRRPAASRLATLAGELRAGGFPLLASLVDDLLGARTPEAQVALANEHLLDLEAELRTGARVAAACARVAAMSALLGLAVRLLDGTQPGPDVVVIAAGGLLGWGGAVIAGRAGGARAAAARQAVDALVDRACAAGADAREGGPAPG